MVSTGVLHGIRAVMARIVITLQFSITNTELTPYRQQKLISRTDSYLALPTLHQKTWSRCQDRQRDRTLRTHTMYPSHVLATLDTVALLVSVEMPATGYTYIYRIHMYNTNVQGRLPSVCLVSHLPSLLL